MKLDDDGILVPHELNDDEKMEKIAYYLCCGKRIGEIKSILTHSF